MTFMIITIFLMDLVNQILLMMLIISEGLNDYDDDNDGAEDDDDDSDCDERDDHLSRSQW